jgi:hypothetical protein
MELYYLTKKIIDYFVTDTYCNDYAVAKAIGFDNNVFMHTLGEIYQSQPAFSEDSHTRLISISALPLPEGKALYDYWQNKPGHKHY